MAAKAALPEAARSSASPAAAGLAASTTKSKLDAGVLLQAIHLKMRNPRHRRELRKQVRLCCAAPHHERTGCHLARVQALASLRTWSAGHVCVAALRSSTRANDGSAVQRREQLSAKRSSVLAARQAYNPEAFPNGRISKVFRQYPGNDWMEQVLRALTESLASAISLCLFENI